jgi:hypothetical protein
MERYLRIIDKEKAMAIIGYKKMGWTKDEDKRRFALLVSFDTEGERDAFAKVIDAVQEVSDKGAKK